MYQLNEVPPPPDSHYVGVIFLYEKDGTQYLLTVKDRDRNEGHINLKLPGGSNTRLFEEYMPYENNLFKILDRLKFEKKALIKILKNERKRKTTLEEYGENKDLTFVLRTMVLECLKKIGYYPFDLEPTVAHVVEKIGHTQYFLEVKTLMDGQGNEIIIPEKNDFKAFDLDIRETRVPVALTDFKTLIASHNIAVEKYIISRFPKFAFKKDEDEDEDE